MAVLGVRCCMPGGFSLVAVSGGSVPRFLIACILLLWSMGSRAWASVIVAYGLSICHSRAVEHAFSNCGSWA